MSLEEKKSSKEVSYVKSNNNEKKLRKYAAMDIEELYKEFFSGKKGLETANVEKNREKYGKNQVTSGVKDTLWRRLKEAFVNPFNIILFIIGSITVFVDLFLDGDGKIDYLTDSIIFILIFVSGALAFIQNKKSNAAAKELSKMISSTTSVYRDGKLTEIPMAEVVVGDVIKFSAGDMIPADVRFIKANDAFVAQSALTGESNPVEKLNFIKNKCDESITDVENIGFMGSNLVSGSAKGIVIATGDSTFFGSVAESLTEKIPQNSFERGVSSVGKLLIRIMLIAVPIVFLIILFKALFLHTNTMTWIDALLFAIAVAIGITPEMLPMVMTSTLAKGAVEMAKSKVIVKNLGSIQTFGEMDVLCTDKTGTLTKDKIVLEKYMDINGEDDVRVLHHAYLNSHFETGLKNLIDTAIIRQAEKSNLKESLKDFKCVDEVPFDFTRRRLSVVLKDDTGFRRLITKGAVEEVMSVCTFMERNGKVVPLTDLNRKTAMKTYEKFNSEGLRMIAVAQKLGVPDEEKFGSEDENEMTLIGFIGFLDPPKESAKIAVETLKEHGVRTVVLTGDSAGVAIRVCEKVSIDASVCITGKEVEGMSEEELLAATEKCNLFAKLTPSQKERVVKAFKTKGHTVGYMGDGINDAPPMHQADVSISVDSAVDIAKETADIILMKKDLMVLEKGVLEGRRIFGNIVKYIKMATSGNVGNIISVLAASLFLPFLPMLPMHILFQNLLADFSHIGIPFDSVDPEYLDKPRKWETKTIKTFTYFMGPMSSVFDILCFLVMWFVFGANTPEHSRLFQCGWFVFGTVSQILVIHMIRTSKVPFLQSRAPLPLMISTLITAAIPFFLGFTPAAEKVLNVVHLPASAGLWIAALLMAYFVVAQVFKKIYIKIHGEWI